jgi:hypothetical protein
VSKRTFWPGFKWRVLAHERLGVHSRAGYTGHSLDLRVDGRPPTGYPGIRQSLDGHWEFDELCIDDWFHLEQMNDRDWWLGVGNGEDYWHINVHIDRDGKATISMEKQ